MLRSSDSLSGPAGPLPSPAASRRSHGALQRVDPALPMPRVAAMLVLLSPVLGAVILIG